VEGLVLGAGRDLAVGRQIGQEEFDFRRSHRVGVAQAVEADEALGPLGVAVLGAGRELADATGPGEAVQQAGRFWAGQVAHGQAEHVVVEEGEGRVGLFQAGQGILLGLGEVFEEAADVAGRQVAGVALVVEEDEPTHPFDILLDRLGPAEVGERRLAKLIEQARRLRRGRRQRAGTGHGETSLTREQKPGEVYE
jgi:hypothetical protein